MKSSTKNIGKPYLSINLNNKTTKSISILLSLAVLNLSLSCSYYNVKNVPTTEETISSTIAEFNESKNYVIVHSGTDYWHLSNLLINEDNQTILGRQLNVESQHSYKESRDLKISHKYEKLQKSPLNELHFYLKTPIDFQEHQQVEIPFSEIFKISVNDKNTGRSTANIVLGTVGVMFAVLLIVAATKSSCPFLYIQDGNEYIFAGELYPGTITSKMQYDDYLSLPNVYTKNGMVTLKISNVLKEIQYTDFVQLVVFNHDDDSEILIDSKGEFQSFKKIETPIKVLVDNQESGLLTALHKDEDYFAFNTPTDIENGTRNVICEFKKPEQANLAKLYLTAKNSVWLDYIYGKFNEQFGVFYNDFQQKQQDVPLDSIYKWKIDQHIPLSVYVKINDSWELVEHLNTVGPMATRNLVVPIDLNRVAGDKIHIKLETGFMFWEVDFIGIDFSENLKIEPKYINPIKAVNQHGNDVTHLINKIDAQYLIQPNIGDEVVVEFPMFIGPEGLRQSLFLKNRGYYNYIRDYKGRPNVEKLKSFKQPGSFTKYSESSYFNIVNYHPQKLTSND